MENPHAPRKDDALVITHYNRTLQQEEMLGLQVSALKKNALEIPCTLDYLASALFFP